MAKYQLGIIYIHRDGFQIFTPGMPSILDFKFVPEIVRDLDVINKELFYNLIKIFISNNKIPKSSLIIVIADSASIIKDFVASAQEDQQQQATEFLDHIPFEEVSSKSIPTDNGIRAYGTNKELYESIKDGFLREEFEILMVLPAMAIGPEVSVKTVLDADAINNILKKEPLLKEYNLLKQPIPPSQPEKNTAETPDATETLKQEKKSNNKTALLTTVFIALLIILFIVYINQPPL